MGTMLLAGALGLWAVIHSWLASAGVKKAARRILGETGFRAYRIIYNAFSLISLIPIALVVRGLSDRSLYDVGTPWDYLMRGGQAAAAVCLFLALLQTGPLTFAGISQLYREGSSSGLITTGFYRFVRHPLYLFGMLMLWPSPSMSLNQLAMNIVATIYLFAGATLEEKRLVQEFGGSYNQYRRATPMIVPLPRRLPRQ